MIRPWKISVTTKLKGVTAIVASISRNITSRFTMLGTMQPTSKKTACLTCSPVLVFKAKADMIQIDSTVHAEV